MKTKKLNTWPCFEESEILKRLGYTHFEIPKKSADANFGEVYTLSNLNENRDSFAYRVWLVLKPADLINLKSNPLYFPNKDLIDFQMSKSLNIDQIQSFVLENAFKNIFFSFPIHFGQDKRYFNIEEVRSIKLSLEKNGILVQQRPDCPAPNLTINESDFLETNFQILHKSTISEFVKFSFIVPVYNNRRNFLFALSQLKNLSTQKNPYELIICDDGSTDGLFEDFKKICSEIDFNVTYVFNPREVERRMGDFNYRAGVARNIGAATSIGEYLIFLDCDIIVPQNILEIISENIKDDEILTCQRRNIKFDEVSESCNSKLPTAIEVEPSKYWEDFYLSSENWNFLPESWKYVSSNNLIIHRNLFKAVGGFSNNFNVYGYEDVDLGFRLKRLGVHFRMLTTKVDHIIPPYNRSEFLYDLKKKNELLKKSCEIFYLNTLCDEVFQHLLCYHNC